MFDDASDAEEIFLRCRDVSRPPVPASVPFHPPHPHVSASPHIKPEDYDETTDWTEYQIYFDQLAELYRCEDERKAMVLGLCLKGKAWLVLTGLNAAQWHSNHAVTSTLTQSFTPQGLVHLYQAELKARVKKADESMADSGWDVPGCIARTSIRDETPRDPGSAKEPKGSSDSCH